MDFYPFNRDNHFVPSNGTAIVQYRVTNQSIRTHTLTMRPILAISQLTNGLGICGNPFVLVGKASCILSLQINAVHLLNLFRMDRLSVLKIHNINVIVPLQPIFFILLKLLQFRMPPLQFRVRH